MSVLVRLFEHGGCGSISSSANLRFRYSVSVLEAGKRDAGSVFIC